MYALGAPWRALRDSLAARPAALWLLLALTLLTVLLGGGSRDDIRSLLLLRPLTALAFVAALMLASSEARARGQSLLILVGAVLLAVLIQLIPLPAGLWSSLGGRPHRREL